MRTAYISFSQQINEKSVQVLSSAMIEQINKRIEHIYLIFSTNGGSVIAGDHLAHFIRSLPVEVTAHNVSMIASMGPAIFMAAKNRYASPNTGFMFHSSGWWTYERIDTRFIRESEEAIKNYERRYIAAMLRDSKLTEKEIKDLLYGPRYFDAKWALDKGVVHEIRDLVIPPGATIVQPIF